MDLVRRKYNYPHFTLVPINLGDVPHLLLLILMISVGCYFDVGHVTSRLMQNNVVKNIESIQLVVYLHSGNSRTRYHLVFIPFIGLIEHDVAPCGGCKGSDYRERDINIVAGGIRVGANHVRFLHQFFSFGLIKARNGDFQLDFNTEAGGDLADTDAAFD